MSDDQVPNPYGMPNPGGQPVQKEVKFDSSLVPIKPIELLTRSKELIGNEYWSFFLVTFIAMLIAGSVPLILMGPMFCGVFLAFRQKMLGRPGGMDYLFKGFDHFGNSLVATLIQFGVILLILMPFGLVIGIILMVAIVGLVESGSEELLPFVIIPVYLFSFVAYMVLLAVVLAPFTFVFQLVADRGMTGGQACKTSWQIVKPRYFAFVWMHMVFFVISILAAMCCVIPAYLFYPIHMGAIAVLYRDICGIQNPPPPQNTPQPTVSPIAR